MTDTAQEHLSRFIWETRYRDVDACPAELGIEDTWRRVAASAAAVERDPDAWSARFLDILRGYRFLPAGRILAGAGTVRRVTLFNCFVMGRIEDSLEGILEALKEGALTMQQGGGVGYDFSTLRPRGSRARTTGMVASGPVSFMHMWDATCATIVSTGARRGAMMATLRCDHPDIGEFIDAKRASGALRHFNLSVLVTDAFLQAVRDGSDWPLVFPEHELQAGQGGAAVVQRAWSDSSGAIPVRVHSVVAARELWQQLCHAAYDCAEPGVLFIDRINEANNLAYCERLSATNPCAEEPLPPYGACDLGSVNLTAFVSQPFTSQARLDHQAIADTARKAVRFLDNIIDISHFPLFRQRERVHRSRRIGLGITGLADALAMLGLSYDCDLARQSAARAMQGIRDAAYEASAELALEKGSFPEFRAPAYLERPFIRALPEALQAQIRRSGMRNSHLTAIAPAGTISLLAHNVSSGIEPSFGTETLRRVLCADGSYQNFRTMSYAYALWRSTHGASDDLPPFFAGGADIAARDHLLMQAALQPYVDGAISKTIAVASDFPRSEVSGLFRSAFELGLKGCTLYREGARHEVVSGCDPASQGLEAGRNAHCCDVNRESD